MGHREKAFALFSQLGHNGQRLHRFGSATLQFFASVGDIRIYAPDERLTSENTSDEEKEIFRTSAASFVNTVMSLTHWNIVSNEIDFYFGILEFRVHMFPLLIRCADLDINWNDVALKLLWLEDKCLFFLKNFVEPQNHREIGEKRDAWWEVNANTAGTARFNRLVSEYELTD
ncbi:hypothetical protein PRIPAC_87130 [Pristionchus pacificus]|uniref:Uncharacterized protein n=1 Tax=Pristionchus pacificus TaxID=54126 RepID=A0A2A6CWZ2_PRIPA|nr:hypothetical protein PRIPAC_87130 [Pristionchus pacificus]|eukprot:PDM82567.1 hypothetical protein PRIPAC_36960 [Pristionchus pacificus]